MESFEWSDFIAILALIISSIPYLKSYFTKPKLEFHIHSNMFITHLIGNPNITLHLTFTNTGWKPVKIYKINLILKKDGKEIVTLPAQNYLAKIGDSYNTLLTHINIEPKKEWSFSTHFLNFFDEEREEIYYNIESRMKQSADNKISNDDKTLIFDKEVISPILKMFDEQFIWRKGEYSFEIQLETDHKETNLSKKYRFTIYDNMRDRLIKIKDNYKYGIGIIFPISDNQYVNINLKEEKL